MSRQAGAYWIRLKKDLGDGKWRIGEWTIGTWTGEEWVLVETGQVLKDQNLIEIGEPINMKIKIDDVTISHNFIGHNATMFANIHITMMEDGSTTKGHIEWFKEKYSDPVLFKMPCCKKEYKVSLKKINKSLEDLVGIPCPCGKANYWLLKLEVQ